MYFLKGDRGADTYCLSSGRDVIESFSFDMYPEI